MKTIVIGLICIRKLSPSFNSARGISVRYCYSYESEHGEVSNLRNIKFRLLSKLITQITSKCGRVVAEVY